MRKFTNKAKELLDEEFYFDEDTLNTYGEEIDTFVTEGLEKPSDAYFNDESLYVTHTLIFHTPDWSLTHDYMEGEANYRAALAELEPYGAEAASVGHWTYSSYSCIRVEFLDAKGRITAGAVRTWLLVQALKDYPFLDESLYGELESEVWNSAVDQAIEDVQHDRESEGDDELTDEQVKAVREYVNENCPEAGCGGDFISEELMDEAVALALDPLPTQEISLF